MQQLASSSMSVFGSIMSIIFLIGVIRGAILLFKDSAKHHKFAKIIRIICGVTQLLAIMESIVLIFVYFNIQILDNTTWLTNFMITNFMVIAAAIGILSVITSIWGAVLLFTASTKVKKFKKIIRIVCGCIMIISIILSFLVSF